MIEVNINNKGSNRHDIASWQWCTEGKTYQSLAKNAELESTSEEATQQTQSNGHPTKQRTVLLKTNDFMGKKVQGLSQVKGYMTTKIKLKGIGKKKTIKESYWHYWRDSNMNCIINYCISIKFLESIILWLCKNISLFLGNIAEAYRGKGSRCMRPTLKWLNNNNNYDRKRRRVE